MRLVIGAVIPGRTSLDIFKRDPVGGEVNQVVRDLHEHLLGVVRDHGGHTVRVLEILPSQPASVVRPLQRLLK